MQNHPKIPKYWKLSQTLREQIESGAYSPGARLPSVAEMKALHGVSLSTVNQAHALLEKDGLVVREQGRGTFVAERKAPRATRTLGFVLHASAGDPYVLELMNGVRAEATRQNMELHWLRDEDVCDPAKADALLMYCHPNEAHTLNAPPQTPHALLFQHSADFNCVAFDDYGGVKLAVRHLLKLGHKRIAFLQDSDLGSVSRQRLAGYRDALAETGIVTNESWVRFLDEQDRLGSYRASAEVAMTQWLENDWRETGCTALVAHNDETAIGAIKALREHGLRVPRDVSVIGFDGTELSELSTPSLTTVKVPLKKIGAAAVQMLAEQMEAGKVGEPQNIILPVKLKMGESCAAVKSKTTKTKTVKRKNKSRVSLSS